MYILYSRESAFIAFLCYNSSTWSTYIFLKQLDKKTNNLACKKRIVHTFTMNQSLCTDCLLLLIEISEIVRARRTIRVDK